MKTMILTSGVLLALAGCATSGPPTAWGKQGVSRIDYGTDIGTCTGRAAQASAGNGYGTAGGVQGSNNAPVMDRDRGGSASRDLNQPMPASTAATSSNLPASGTYQGMASADYAQRAATQQRAQEMTTKKIQAETFRSCLAERGYSEFALTPEQRARLGSLTSGSNEYHEYLYSLSTSLPAAN